MKEDTTVGLDIAYRLQNRLGMKKNLIGYPERKRTLVIQRCSCHDDDDDDYDVDDDDDDDDDKILLE
jgi:hypothetical protein